MTVTCRTVLNATRKQAYVSVCPGSKASDVTRLVSHFLDAIFGLVEPEKE